MNNTALESLADMVRLWEVWHQLDTAEMLFKISGWANSAYSEADQIAAKAHFGNMYQEGRWLKC